MRDNYCLQWPIFQWIYWKKKPLQLLCHLPLYLLNYSAIRNPVSCAPAVFPSGFFEQCSGQSRECHVLFARVGRAVVRPARFCSILLPPLFQQRLTPLCNLWIAASSEPTIQRSQRDAKLEFQSRSYFRRINSWRYATTSQFLNCHFPQNSNPGTAKRCWTLVAQHKGRLGGGGGRPLFAHGNLSIACSFSESFIVSAHFLESKAITQVRWQRWA